jgi:hypothetical protein
MAIIDFRAKLVATQKIAATCVGADLGYNARVEAENA